VSFSMAGERIPSRADPKYLQRFHRYGPGGHARPADARHYPTNSNRCVERQRPSRMENREHATQKTFR
jgi:hypothetical protein